MKLRVYEEKSWAEILPWFHIALTDKTDRQTGKRSMASLAATIEIRFDHRQRQWLFDPNR